MPRNAVCHVCMCALTRPGITMQPLASISSASCASSLRPTSTIRSSSTRMSSLPDPTTGSIEMTWPPLINLRIIGCLLRIPDNDRPFIDCALRQRSLRHHAHLIVHLMPCYTYVSQVLFHSEDR